jgi:predicted GNAT family N-acyltransferase
MTPVIRTITIHSPAYALTVALRDRILRRPLGLYFSEAQLAAEAAEFHLTAWDNDLLVGCLCLKPIDAFTLQMRQVAVLEEKQGQGIGQQLVVFAENFAREHLFQKMILHARETAVPFYHKLGYTPVGDTFIEVTLLHQAFEKMLTD